MFIFKVTKTEHVCPVCGKQFTARKEAVTCSNACREKLYRQRKLSRLVVEKIRRAP